LLSSRNLDGSCLEVILYKRNESSCFEIQTMKCVNQPENDLQRFWEIKSIGGPNENVMGNFKQNLTLNSQRYVTDPKYLKNIRIISRIIRSCDEIKQQ